MRSLSLNLDKFIDDVSWIECPFSFQIFSWWSKCIQPMFCFPLCVSVLTLAFWVHASIAAIASTVYYLPSLPYMKTFQQTFWSMNKHIPLAFRIGSLTFDDWAISPVLNIYSKERVSTGREILPILPCLRTPGDNFNNHNLEGGVATGCLLSRDQGYKGS